jgi:cytochrome c oxidase subunit 1
MPVPADPPGLAGWVSTSDHKRVGRLFIATSLLFLLLGTVLAALVAVEGTKSGLELFNSTSSFGEALNLSNESLVLLFLVPMFLGVATFLVPLQVGSAEIAFPRGSATAFWLYLVSAGLTVGSYLASGGQTGSRSAAVDLWLIGLLGVLVAITIGLVSVLTTIMTMRVGGMTMIRVPSFTWSVLVAGSLLLLSVPVLAARLIAMYVSHHFGSDLGDYQSQIAWFWSIPTVYLLAVPAAGVALEVVPVLARNRVRVHGAALAVLGALGVVGVGMWAQSAETFDDVLYVLMAFAAVLPALALLGLVGDTARGGRPKMKAAFVLSLGAVLLLLLGAVAGALQSIDGLDLQRTTWTLGQMHLVVLGAGTLGGLAALWWWAPKFWGVELPEGAGFLVGLAALGGSLLLAVPELINGLANDLAVRGTAATRFTDDSVKALNGISAAGAVLLTLAGLLVVLVLLGSIRKARRGTADNPWGAHTLEWATTSPPAPGNFTSPVLAVTSATPLHEETAR